MTCVAIAGVGCCAPGLNNWRDAAAVLRGAAPYVGAPVAIGAGILTGELRRRSGEHIRLAVQVAAEAVAQAGYDAATLASVFASSESDGHVTHHICEAVAAPAPQVSPTRFHNSVNNAPAGYWSMAVQSQAPSTSVAGFDASFAVGLIEAYTQVLIEGVPVLFVAHDIPLPAPLHAVRPLSAACGIALVLAPAGGDSATRTDWPRLALAHIPATAETALTDPALEALRRGNPAARGLSLLQAMALRGGAVHLPAVAGASLRATVSA